MKRRIFSVILSLIMLLSLLQINVFADNTTTFEKATTIEDGVEYLLVGQSSGSGSYYAVKATENGYPSRESVTVSGTSIASASDDCIWTASVTDGQATFAQGSKYLYRSSNSGNIKQGTATDASQWSYDGLHLTTQVDSNTYYVKYGSSSSSSSTVYFTTTSSEANITLYKKTISDGGEVTPPVSETGNVYKLTDSLTAGKEYLIVDTNAAGSGYALKNGGSDMANANVTVQSGDVDGDGTSDTYIVSDDTTINWAAAANGSGFNLSNGGSYLEGKSGEVKIYSSLNYTDRYWTYSGNQLQHKGGQNTYTVFYNNGFTSDYNTVSNKVYVFEKTSLTGEGGGEGGGEVTPPVSETGNVYKLIDSLTAGKEYLIVDTNAAGSGYALKNGGSDMANANVTVQSGDVDGDGTSDTYIVSDDTTINWAAAANGSGFNLSNGGSYLEGKSGEVKIYSSLNYTDRYWTYSGNQLQHKGGQNTYTVFYNNGFTSDYNTVSNKVYVFEKTSLTGEGGGEGGGEVTPTDPSGSATYLAFTSDVHNDGNNTSANRLDSWLNTVSGKLGGNFDEIGFCGDCGSASASESSFWTYTQAVMDVTKNNTHVNGNGIFVAGNHEWYNGNIGSTSNAVASKYKAVGDVVETDDYIIYCFGASQWDEIFTDDNIAALDAYLKAHADFGGPIFILAHFPMHCYSGSGESRSIHDGKAAVGTAKVINVLNEHPNTIFLWGHNHSSNNDHYDSIYTDKINNTDINFTYAAAGCMSDSEYGQSVNVKGKGLTATIYDDSVVLAYYDVSGNVVGTPVTIPMSGGSTSSTEYTITAKAGTNGSISPDGTVSVKEGKSKTFTFAPDAGYEVDTLLVNGEAVTVSGNSYTISNVKADASISVSFKKIQGTAYELATEITAGQYILVSNGYALYNNKGQISAVPITISGNSVIVSDSNIAGATWTFSEATGTDKSGDYEVKNGDYYFSRVSDSSGSSVAAEITTAKKNSEASGLPYYQWSYDVANGQLSHIGGQDKSATFYAYYDTSASAFYTATSEHELKLYVVSKTQPETPHEHVFGDVVYTWTESGDGYTCTASRTCTDSTCAEKETATVTATYTVTTKPGCETTGVGTYTANFENAAFASQTKQVEIKALGHDLIHHDAKDATCTVSGWEAYDTCSRCDYTTYKEIAAIGHDFSGEMKNIDGDIHAYKCIRCNEYGNNESHAYGEWTKVDDSQHQKVCACGIVIKENHSWNDGVVTTAATCTKDGVKTFTCVCGATKTEAIPATGHTVVIDAAVAATCTEAGKSEGSHCSVCHEVIKAQEVVPAKGHTVVIDAAVAATCTENGLTEGQHCSVCNYVLKEQTTVLATGHSYVNGTCTHCGKSALSRIAGIDRYETAVEISRVTFPNGSKNVILVNGLSFPDALAATPLAYLLDAPVLMQNGTAAVVNQSTMAEIERLGATNIYIMGGTGAVSSAVEASLQKAGYIVHRIADSNRYGTAAAIADTYASQKSFDTVVIACGLNYPDALGVGSAAAINNMPILFVNTNSIPDETVKVLDKYGVKNAIIVGGTGVVSTTVEMALNGKGISVTRLAGSDRFETSVAIAKYFFPTATTAVTATGMSFADAIAGGVAAAKASAPILLVNGTGSSLPASIQSYIKNAGIQKMSVLGGTGAVSEKMTGLLKAQFN